MLEKIMIISIFLFFPCVLAIPTNDQKQSTKNLVTHHLNEGPVVKFNSNKTSTNQKTENTESKQKGISKEKDLQGSAAEYGVQNFAHPSDVYGFYPAKDCYTCNDQPWVPIYGRSLAIPQHNEYHSGALGQDFHHKASNFQPFYPNLDEYSAPQSGYEYPRPGEVLEFMLPPPLSLHKPFTSFGGLDKPSSGPTSFGGNIYSTSFKKIKKPQPFRYSTLSQSMVPPPYSSGFGSNNFASDFSFTLFDKLKPGYKPEIIKPAFTSPVVAENHPGVDNLPLSYSNFNLNNPVPSDSYGQPLSPNAGHTPSFNPLPTLSDSLQLPPVGATNFYASSFPQFDSVSSAQQKLPFVRPSDSYGQAVTGGDLTYFDANPEGPRPPHIESLKASLFKTGTADVQVVPSVKIADYTASVEHPINLIQSPILDLVAKNPNLEEPLTNFEYAPSHAQNTHSKHNVLDLDVATNNDNFKLSEKPVVVQNDDSESSATTTVNASVPTNSTTIKRHNDKYLSTTYNNGNNNQNVNWFKNMILENHKDTTDQKSIVAIKKLILNPNDVKANLKIAQPHVNISTWRSLSNSANSSNNYYNILDHMIPPPKPESSAWISVVNNKSKRKPIQIIVPYVKHSNKSEYTTLSTSISPPPFIGQQSLWPKYSADQNVQSNRYVEKTTQVYNIKDFISQNAHSPAEHPLPYDVISLQKNIDKWTHQSYSNIKGYGAFKGVEAENKKKPDVYLNHDKKVLSVDKTNVTTDEIIGSSSENIEQTVSFNEINDEKINEVNNDIDDDLSYNDLINDYPEDDVETTTVKRIKSSTMPTIKFRVKQEKQLWNFIKETKSNGTHEKVYVVTPQSYAFVTSTPATAFSMAPKIQNGKVNKHPGMTKISVRVERQNVTRLGENLIGHPVKVVFSEWPHIINNLETTTTNTIKATSRHPLFGLMDIPNYTPKANTTVETLGGHSRVTMAVTPSTLKVTTLSSKQTKQIR